MVNTFHGFTNMSVKLILHTRVRCGHCKVVEPIFEKVASQVAEDRTMGESSAVLGKVDATAEKYLSGSSFSTIPNFRFCLLLIRPQIGLPYLRFPPFTCSARAGCTITRGEKPPAAPTPHAGETAGQSRGIRSALWKAARVAPHAADGCDPSPPAGSVERR